jgi:hypothetical protein
MENISVIRDFNSRLITESIEKVNSLNSYYAPVISKTACKYSQLTQVNHKL